MKIRTRLTNLSASKRRVSSLFTWNKMDSSYITCFDTCTVARTRRIMVRLHSFERENSSSHPIWKFLRLETARTVTCSRGKIDVKWNDFSVIFCSIDVERDGANTKERESWCNWRPHGVDRNETRASKLCVRVSVKTRGWKKQQTSPAHWSSNNGSFMCNHRRNRGCRRNALFDPKKRGLTRAKRISCSSRPTRISRFLWSVFTRIRNGSNQRELNLFRPFLFSDRDREEIIYLIRVIAFFCFFFFLKISIDSKIKFWTKFWFLILVQA